MLMNTPENTPEQLFDNADISNMTPIEYRKHYLREYARAHKEQTNKSKAKWREKNRQHTRDYAKSYYSKNKDNYASRYEENKEEKKKNARDYHRSERGSKAHHISYWKRRGIIHNDYEALYNEYTTKTKCDKCDKEFGERGDGTGSYKCIAIFPETKQFESVCCYKCMNRDKVVAKMKARKSNSNVCIKPSKTQTEKELPLTEK